MAKVSISSLVVVGAKEIIRSGKLYDESVDLPAVIKSAMDKAACCTYLVLTQLTILNTYSCTPAVIL